MARRGSGDDDADFFLGFVLGRLIWGLIWGVDLTSRERIVLWWGEKEEEKGRLFGLNVHEFISIFSYQNEASTLNAILGITRRKKS